MNTITAGETVTFKRFHALDIKFDQRGCLTEGKEYTVNETRGVVKATAFAIINMGAGETSLDDIMGEQVLCITDDEGYEFEITTWHTRED